MSRIAKSFRVALESQQEQVPETPVVSDPAIDQAVELAEQQAKFEKASDDFETLSDVAEALESIATSMESLRDTGLTPQAAYYMNMAVDGLSKRAGFDQPATLGMEAFIGHRARISTTISMEGVKERVQQVLELLAKAWEQIRAVLKRFVTSITAGIGQMTKTMEQLVEHARQYGTQSDMLEIGFASKLSIDGKVPAGLSGLEITLGVAEDTLTYGIAHDEGANFVRRAMEGMLAAKSNAEFESAKGYISKFTNPVPRSFKHKSGDRDDGYRYETDVVSGETRFQLKERMSPRAIDSHANWLVSSPSERDYFAALLRIGNHTFASYIDRSKAPQSAKVAPLSVHEIDTVYRAMSKLEELCKKAWSDDIEADKHIAPITSAVRAGQYNHLSGKNQDVLVRTVHVYAQLLQQRARMQHAVLANAVHTAREYVHWAAMSVKSRESAATA